VKYLEVEMSDGSVWRVPAGVIACHRAGHYAAREKCEADPYAKIFEEELDFTMSNAHELIDWAKNNMEWKYVSEFASMYKPANANIFHKSWANAPMQVIQEVPND